MKNSIVLHPAVVRVVLRVLATYGFTERDARHAVADVTVRVIEALEDRGVPTSLAEWQMLAGRTAAVYAVDERGKAPLNRPAEIPLGDGVRLGRPGGSSGETLLFWLFGDPRSEVQTRRQGAVLGEMLERGEMPDEGRRILSMIGGGASAAVVARRLGLEVEEVRRRLRVMRTRFFRRLEAAAASPGRVLEDEGEDEATQVPR